MTPDLPPDRRWPALLGLLAGLLLAPGCDRGDGDAKTGAPCRRDADCAGGHCVRGVAGPEPACTRVCASDDDCPAGWSCGAVSQRGTVLCQEGGSTPLGPAPGPR